MRQVEYWKKHNFSKGEWEVIVASWWWRWQNFSHRILFWRQLSPSSVTGENSSAVVKLTLIEKVKLENPAILSPLSVGKVQSWIAKAEAERFPESLTRLPPFPQPPPPWLEEGWHGRWDSNAGVGGPTKLEGPPPHHEIPSTGPPRPTMATTLFFTRRKYYLPHLEDGTVDFRSKYLGLLGYTQPTNHTASLGSNWC